MLLLGLEMAAKIALNQAAATETVDSGSIPGRVKPKTIKKLLFTAFAFDVQHQKRQYEASTVCGRQVVA